jgi:hypothetical protein
MRPMKDSSATGGDYGRMNKGGEIHSSATQSLYTDERKEDEEMRRTGIIQSERQVFEMARAYFGLNRKGGPG